MLLTAFCIAMSNTHSRGRHSSSISLVDDEGKYLGNSQEHTRTHVSAHTAHTDMSTNRCRQANTAEDTNMHTDQQYAAQLKIKAIHYPVHKLHDHRG